MNPRASIELDDVEAPRRQNFMAKLPRISGKKFEGKEFRTSRSPSIVVEYVAESYVSFILGPFLDV